MMTTMKTKTELHAHIRALDRAMQAIDKDIDGLTRQYERLEAQYVKVLSALQERFDEDFDDETGRFVKIEYSS